MIANKNFDYDLLFSFLEENDKIFTRPLSESLKQRNTTLSEWCHKICTKSTIAYELDDDNTLKGLVIGYTDNLPINGGGYITIVATNTKFRKQNVATNLLNEYIEYARLKNIPFLWLTTYQKNTVARKTYEKCNFELESIENELCKYILKL